MGSPTSKSKGTSKRVIVGAAVSFTVLVALFYNSIQTAALQTDQVQQQLAALQGQLAKEKQTVVDLLSQTKGQNQKLETVSEQQRGEIESLKTALKKETATPASASIPTEALRTGSQTVACVVTVCLQTSIDRLNRVEDMLRSYDGPVSVAIGCRSAQEASQALRWAQASSKSMKRSLGVAGSTNTTASFIVDTVLYDSDSVTFPVNLLRNRAVSAAKTTHVLSLDVDFAPSAALCSHLTTQLQLLNLPNPVALVVATFETLSNSIPAPSTFKELMVQIEEGSSATVHEHFGPAHRPTEYGRYLAMTADNCAPASAICQPYEIQYDALYEPYYALQKSANMPTYPESFTSYGNDKAAHAYELAEAGFTFAVALGVFATHMWHQPAKWSAAGNRDVVWMQWWTFTQEVAERYNKTSRRETPEWFREHLTYYNGGKWYPEKLSDCQNLNTLNWGRTPFSCKPSSNGRCGPRFGTYCSGERDLWCAESSGWCGSTGDHQRSQTSSAYHYKDAGLWREYCCKESLKLTYGKCLDAPQNTSGGKVHLWDCTPGIQNQQWTYTASTKQMKLVHGNKCLGIVDVALNAHAQRNEGRDEVRLWDCDLEKQNQQWTYMASTQQMKLTHGNKCLAVTGVPTCCLATF